MSILGLHSLYTFNTGLAELSRGADDSPAEDTDLVWLLVSFYGRLNGARERGFGLALN